MFSDKKPGWWLSRGKPWRRGPRFHCLSPVYTPQHTTARLQSCQAELHFPVNERYPQHLSIRSGLAGVCRCGLPLKTGLRCWAEGGWRQRPLVQKEAGQHGRPWWLVPLIPGAPNAALAQFPGRETCAQLVRQQRGESSTCCGILNITLCSFSKDDLKPLPHSSSVFLKNSPQPSSPTSIFF